MEIAGGTADSAFVAEDISEGVHITEEVGSRELDSHVTYNSSISIFYALGTIACLFVGGGVNGK